MKSNNEQTKTPPYDGGVEVIVGFDEAVARDCTWPELPSRKWIAPNNISISLGTYESD